MNILLGYVWPLIVFLFTLVILVVIHEFGHFIMCKKFNIKVLEFGFGIPPRAWGKKVGETLISVNWLPLGGFVRPLGEDEDVDVKKLSDKERKEWNERSFQTQNVWKRVIVVVAGVVMNLLLAWILFYIVIIAQNFKVIYPAIEPTISVQVVDKGYPASASLLKVGDRILAINGQTPSDVDSAIQLIRAGGDQGIDLTYSDINGGNIQKIHLVGKLDPDGVRRIGVALSPIPIKQYTSLPEKVFSGITYSWDVTRTTFLGIGKIGQYVQQQNYSKASEGVTGMVGLAVVTKNIVQQGWEAFLFYLWFAGAISLTLFIFNILPIPALDGGRLFFLLFEGITHKKVNPEIEKRVHAVGMAVLIALLILVNFKDFGVYILPKLQHILKF